MRIGHFSSFRTQNESQWYLNMLPVWRMLRVAYLGDLAFKGRISPTQYPLNDGVTDSERVLSPDQIKYLIKTPYESDGVYEFRARRATYYNIMALNLTAFSDFVFQDKSLEFNLSDVALEQLASVDTTGRDIWSVGKALFEDSLLYGYCHAFVDTSAGVEPSTAARDSGEFRAFIHHIQPQQLFYAHIDESQTLSRVFFTRVTYQEAERSGESNFPVPQQLAVTSLYELTRDSVTIRRYKPGDTTSLSQDNLQETRTYSHPLGRLPLVTLYTAETSEPFMTKPILVDLATKNLEHWQTSSEQNLSLSLTRNPLLASFGADPKAMTDINAKSGVIIPFANENARLEFISAKADSLSAGEKDIAIIEDQMANLGLDLMRPRREDTATRQNLAAQSSTNTLESATKEFLVGYNQLIGMYLERLGISEQEAKIDPDKDFVYAKVDFSFLLLGDEELRQIAEVCKSNKLSVRTFSNILRNKGLFPRDENPEDEADILRGERDLLEPTNQGGVNNE